MIVFAHVVGRGRREISIFCERYWSRIVFAHVVGYGRGKTSFLAHVLGYGRGKNSRHPAAAPQKRNCIQLRAERNLYFAHVIGYGRKNSFLAHVLGYGRKKLKVTRRHVQGNKTVYFPNYGRNKKPFFSITAQCMHCLAH